jgi:hypothetical protein
MYLVMPSSSVVIVCDEDTRHPSETATLSSIADCKRHDELIGATTTPQNHLIKMLEAIFQKVVEEKNADVVAEYNKNGIKQTDEIR